ncbi:MAG: hypothetical protein E7407_03375 [Ruminococcaceae bacterium]|nr:hypothetical protein [Oscillospiraceae bacterium]
MCFYGETFESVNAFINELKRYIDYFNNERIFMKLKDLHIFVYIIMQINAEIKYSFPLLRE